MIKNYEHVKLSFDYRNGDYCKNRSKLKRTQIDVICDKCGHEFTERYSTFKHRIDLIGYEYCGQCSRPIVAGLAGYKGTHDVNGNVKLNKGNFSTERWNYQTEEELVHSIEHLTNIAIQHHKFLNENPDKKFEQYQKVFKHSTIGYISKGQREIYDILKNDGYVLDGIVSGMKVDVVNIDKKIAIEYNGDMWHCNPKKWKSEQYNTAIKMTAGEKWQLDRRRRFKLRRLGYDVHVIWESAWNTDRTTIYELLQKITDINYEFPVWEYKKSQPLKGRTFDEIYGTERSAILKENSSKARKGVHINDYIWKITTPNGIFYTKRKGDWTSINKYTRHYTITYEKIPYSENYQFWDGMPIIFDMTITCPHCGKQGIHKTNMTRYHFNNCKYRNKNETT